MTYRNTLIERSKQSESQNDEPAVLDYLQLRNRQCLYAWRMKRAQYALANTRPCLAKALELRFFPQLWPVRTSMWGTVPPLRRGRGRDSAPAPPA